MSQTHATHRTGRSGQAAIEWLAVVLVAVALLVVAATSGGSPQVDVSATRTVGVSAGDTLWEIASRHPITGLSTAQTVEVLAELNDVEGSLLTAGSSVIVPVEDADPRALALR